LIFFKGNENHEGTESMEEGGGKSLVSFKGNCDFLLNYRKENHGGTEDTETQRKSFVCLGNNCGISELL